MYVALVRRATPSVAYVGMRLPAELHFVEPIAKWQLTDRERHHRLDEREAICCALFHRMQGLGFASMPDDPAHQLNRFECQADFSYEITPKTIKIRDAGKGREGGSRRLGGGIKEDRGMASRLYRRLPHQLQGTQRGLGIRSPGTAARALIGPQQPNREVS